LPPYAKTADLSGPRFGLTLLSDGVVQALAERDIHVGPHISQFGWQFEKQFYTKDSGVTMVTEWVGLVGGLEQSVALPSLSWLVGVRTRDGAEFGMGRNITPAGTAMVLATGMTFRTGALNIPVEWRRMRSTTFAEIVMHVSSDAKKKLLESPHGRFAALTRKEFTQRLFVPVLGTKEVLQRNRTDVAEFC